MLTPTIAVDIPGNSGGYLIEETSIVLFEYPSPGFVTRI